MTTHRHQEPPPKDRRHEGATPNPLSASHGSHGRDGPDGGEVVRSEPATARGAETRPPEAAPGHAHAHPPEGDGGPSHAGNGERLIRSSESDDLRRRWESIQASFIDAPRDSVLEADHLVGELTDRIAKRFRSERSHLEERWGRGDDVSTEDLRITLQRYRGFFDRLLRL